HTFVSLLSVQHRQASDTVCFCVTGSRAQTDSVLQPQAEVAATEGEAVTLGCQYNSSSSNHYLFWYKQDGNNSPKFILSRFKVGSGETEDEERFSSTLDSTLRSVPLKIQKLHLSDSAVYYCAMRPTVTGNTTTLYKNLWRETSLAKDRVTG
uniref:Ig-like domain-containing protein n=1 Tax=Cyclopterus lumpus TaxID=8103 RepID=A0A8C2ZVC7_CYCLU